MTAQPARESNLVVSVPTGQKRAEKQLRKVPEHAADQK